MPCSFQYLVNVLKGEVLKSVCSLLAVYYYDGVAGPLFRTLPNLHVCKNAACNQEG